MTLNRSDQEAIPVRHLRIHMEQKSGSMIRPISGVVHVCENSYQPCPMCGQQCAYWGDANVLADEAVIRPADWEIELHCPEHGNFRVLAGNLIRQSEFFK
jgi:hypothetical protein